jgi:hypothetical protein
MKRHAEAEAGGAENGSDEDKAARKKHKKDKKEKKEKNRERDKEGLPSSKPSGSGKPSVGSTAAAAPEAPPAEEVTAYPYIVDSADHCESPLEAYKDISFFLEKIAIALNKTKDSLRIYDPYFCEGSMVERLAACGFPHVYNKKEDFYAVTAAGENPEFDVLVTNPPYSGDNVEKLLNFSLSCGKPFFLLMPNYVYGKDYYNPLSKKFPGLFPNSMFYVAPKSRYLYTTKVRRQQKSAKYTSPFPSFWYCSLGSSLASSRDNIMGAALRYSVLGQGTGYSVAPSVASLPLDVLDDNDPRKKKYKNSLKRKKNKARKKVAS